MSDFNNKVKIIVTVIEDSKAESFILNSIDCPFDCSAGEFSKALKEAMADVDYEALVSYYRDKKFTKLLEDKIIELEINQKMID